MSVQFRSYLHSYLSYNESGEIMNLSYQIDKDEHYDNVLHVLKEQFLLSDRLITKLKKANKIYLNSLPTYTKKSVTVGDTVSVLIDFEEDNSNIVASNIPLNIIYEDDYLLVINKPANIAIHPSILHFDNSLSNGVKFYFDKLGLKKKIRIVNRLDRNTSGIVVFAKNEYIQECLIKQMKTKELKKEYLAIAKGILESKSGTLNFPIARKEGSIIERTVSSDGDSAITHYDVVKEFNNLSLVHIVLETGRTHQIRVHFSYIGHPILGDTLYGSPSKLINRQALHSYKLTFIHPVTKKVVSLEAPLPNDIKNIINN
jgi:23S rRNA pseudouridine1911/1915/1917 synthase